MINTIPDEIGKFQKGEDADEQCGRGQMEVRAPQDVAFDEDCEEDVADEDPDNLREERIGSGE
jgi:hypothetical protein